MAEIRVATDANFEELVLKSERPVVVDFWAAWCGPCKMVAPEMEKLAAKYDGAVDVVKVDVDANPGLSQAFNILSIPVIAFFRPGQQPQGVVGLPPARAARADLRPGRVRRRQGRLSPTTRTHVRRPRSAPGPFQFPEPESAAADAPVGGGKPGCGSIRGVTVQDGRPKPDPARTPPGRRDIRRSRRRGRHRPIEGEFGGGAVRGSATAKGRPATDHVSPRIAAVDASTSATARRRIDEQVAQVHPRAAASTASRSAR